MSKIDELYPQTKEELEIARTMLDEELKKRQMSGIPSQDKAWRKYYTTEQLNVSIPQMSMSDYLYDRNKNRLDLNAINYKGKKITYEELFYRIEDTAKRFQKYGVKESDYVNLALPVSPETIYMIYGLDKIGASAALIDPRVNQERMEYYLNLVKSNICGITGLYAGTMRNALRDSKNKLMINISPLQTFDKNENKKLKALYELKMLGENLREIIFNITQANKNNKIITSKKFYTGDLSYQELYVPKYVNDRTAVVEYTSGTTGVPKGLELSAASINLVVEQLKDLIECEPGQTILGIMPPFISYGIVCGTHNAFSSGLESILIPNFSPEIFSELVMKYKPNNIVCVPSFLQLFMNSNLVDSKTDLSFIKNIIIGGNKIGIEFERDFNNWLKKHNCNITISKGGGMAEFSSCLFYTPNEETKKPGVYGLPMPAVDAKIVDINGKELGYYEVGEIHISSAQNMKGYYSNEEATEEFFYTDENGKKYGRSGDLGYVDINGVFTLLDRKKEMVIRPDGHNVFPSEIMAIINEHYAVNDSLVVGIKDHNVESGEWPTAFVELKTEYLQNSDKIMKEIKELCKLKLPLRDRPRDEDYIQVKKIITTVEGKINAKETIDEENYCKKLIKD